MWNQWSNQSISKKLLTSTLPKAFKGTKHPWQNRVLCIATWLVKRHNQKLGVNGQTCIVKEAYQWNTTGICTGICSPSHTCNWPGKVTEHWSNQVFRWYQFIHGCTDEGQVVKNHRTLWNWVTRQWNGKLNSVWISVEWCTWENITLTSHVQWWALSWTLSRRSETLRLQ